MGTDDRNAQLLELRDEIRRLIPALTEVYRSMALLRWSTRNDTATFINTLSETLNEVDTIIARTAAPSGVKR